MLRAEGIRKSFGDIDVLKGVDLAIERGEIHAVLGLSGSGKTTLLRCIDFLEIADAGTISVGGISVDCKSATKHQQIEIRRHMGFVFQHHGLFRNKTALENVTLGLTVVHGMEKGAAKERGLAVLEKVGLLDRADSYPAQLSGGQQQRVGIARALAPNPDIILMDEPTSSLDPSLVSEVLDTIAQLANEGTTMLIVTHELAFARDVATNILYMHDGVICESAPTSEFFSNPQKEETKEFLRGARTLHPVNPS